MGGVTIGGINNGTATRECEVRFSVDMNIEGEALLSDVEVLSNRTSAATICVEVKSVLGPLALGERGEFP